MSYQSLIEQYLLSKKLYLEDNGGNGSVLSKPCTPAIQSQLNFANELSPFLLRMELMTPIYFGTITTDPKEYGQYTIEEQETILIRHMRKYIGLHRKKLHLVWAIEYHSDFRPHIHMLTNGNLCHFKTAFKVLGRMNCHKKAIQQTTNILDVYNYISKPCPRASKMKIRKTIHLFYNDKYINNAAELWAPNRKSEESGRKAEAFLVATASDSD